MRHIQTIEAHNFNGRTFKYELAPVTIICGGNFRGKTAISNAVKVLLTGSHPELGKQHGSTFRLACDEEMGVLGRLSDGRTLSHRWQRSEKGIKYTGNIPEDLAVPSILLSVNDYLSKTGPERIQYVFERIDVAAGGFTDATVTGCVDSADCPANLKGQLTEKARAIITSTIEFRDRKKQSIPEWVQQLIDTVQKGITSANDTAKRKSAEVSAFRNFRPKPKDATEELKTASAELERVIQQHGREAAEAEQRARDAARLKTIAATLEEMRLTDESAVKAELAQIETERTRIQRAEAEQLRLLGEWQEAGAKLRELDTHVEVRLNAMKREELRFVGLKELGLCESCMTRITEEHHKTYDVLAVELHTDVDARDKQNELTDAAGKKVTQADAESKANAPLLEEMDMRGQDINAAMVLFAEKSKLGQAANSQPTNQDASKVIQDARDQVQVLRQQMQDLADWNREDSRRKESQDALLLAQAEADYLKGFKKALMEKQDELLLTAFNGLLETSTRFTDGLLNSRLEYFNRELGRRASEQDVACGFVGQVGWWIPLDTFSGTEQLLAYSGICVALAADSPIKLVIMDELGNVHRTVKPSLMQRMSDLVAEGVIGQFIGIDADGEGYRSMTGVSVIEV